MTRGDERRRCRRADSSGRLRSDVQEVHGQRVVVFDLDLLGFLVPAHPRGGNELAFALSILVDMDLDQSELVLKTAELFLSSRNDTGRFVARMTWRPPSGDGLLRA